MAEEAEGAKRRNRGPDERHKRMRAAFAQAFLGALAEKKVSQVEVANAIGEPAYTVSRYAKQKTTPTKQTLDKMAAFLDMDAADLMPGFSPDGAPLGVRMTSEDLSDGRKYVEFSGALTREQYLELHDLLMRA